LPNYRYIELGQLETHSDYAKYQGRSFTLLLVDEAGQYQTPDLLDLMRSNLRGPREIPIRVVIAANPGGVGHAHLAKRYVFRSGPWKPFHEERSKRTWVYAPSTFDGNQFLDRKQYRAQPESACPHDKELLRAWVEGDWTVARGAYFASVLDEHRNAIDPWPSIPEKYGEPWETYLAHDFGSSAPSVTYIVCKSPGGEAFRKFYPRGSLILVDELSTAKPDRLNEGMGWTVGILAEEILALCKRWNVKAKGVADDAIFARTGSGAGSISDELTRAGVRFYPAKKGDRISGCQLMRRMLADAGKPDVPGLYVSRGCTTFGRRPPIWRATLSG
jgi:hypothetical protein